MLVVILLTTSGMIPEVVERRHYVESAVPAGAYLKDERVAKAEPPLTIRVGSGFLLNTTPAKCQQIIGMSSLRRPEQKPSLYG